MSMSRATFSSRRTRRAVPAAKMNQPHQAVKGRVLKNHAPKEEALPRTVSTSCSSSAPYNTPEAPPPQTVSTGCSSTASEAQGPQHDQKLSQLCPVTGHVSNILDDYMILPQVLGKGHYGCVRKCVHRSSRFSYACKSIDKSKTGRLDHLRREVQLLSQVDHRGIVKMVDCYEDADCVHIVTEKYTGGELFDKIVDNATEDGCFSERRAARILKSLLESVAYLHGNDIVHRDIKPENIVFVSETEDAVKLVDFGLSRRHSEAEAPMRNPVGSAYYMSPELLRGRYDRSTDVWSIGSILYILLCGYPPFNGDTDPDIFEAINEGNLEFPARQWADKSEDAKDLVRCLLRWGPRRRLTAREALGHPWIRSGGGRKVPTRNNQIINYLKMQWRDDRSGDRLVPIVGALARQRK